MDYSNYQPLILEADCLGMVTSEEYRQFILDAAIVPGCRLIVERSKQREDWPYVDTKFNPNTGQDLPPESYDVLHAWFLGRGSEALAEHSRRLGQVEGGDDQERNCVREVFDQLVDRMTSDIVKILDQNNGRFPFRVDLKLNAIDEGGRPIEMEPGRVGAGDLFAAKGLASSGEPGKVARAVEVFRHATGCIRGHRFDVQQFAEQPRDFGQRGFMLALGGVGCLYRNIHDAEIREELLALAEEFIRHVLDLHYDPDTAVFAESVSRDTGEPLPCLDPGHATEFVGFGLAAVEYMGQSSPEGVRWALMDRARREMPRLLVKAVEQGFNKNHAGLYRTVNTQTGAPINDNMPWWNLPETMRAAARCMAVVKDAAVREPCAEAFRLCHNAYFKRYLNRDNMLFPYQSISGATGRVVDKAPAVPEGDPLYHSNLAFLDMLDVLEH